MPTIKHVYAREILNAKGIPTVEATVILSDSTESISSTPGRTSIGGFEATEVVDHDPAKFGGQGVLKVVDSINSQIGPKLVGIDPIKQREIDHLMIGLDGTPNKSKFGVNAILSVSMAIAKAGSMASGIPLFLYLRQYIGKEGLSSKIPTPCFNILNGGKIAGGNLDFQSFILIPASSKSYSDSLQLGTTIYQRLKDILQTKNLPTLIGDEGGFGPKLSTNEEGLSLIKQTVERTSFRLGFDIFLGLDCSANNFYIDKKYKIKDKPIQLSSNDLISYYEELNSKYHLLYLEDPFYEDDWDGWAQVSKRVSENTIIVGDHLTSTNSDRLRMAIEKNAATGIVIKPSQVGTVIEALEVVEIARRSNMKIIVSSTSAETNDDFIADFAVAISADYVKFGAPARGENISKYNKLLELEEKLESIN